MEKYRYEELRPEEFLARLAACPIAYLPLGTLEWHGLHLPLGADGLQAHGVFCRMAEELGGVVLPSLFLGPDSAAERDGKPYYGMDNHSFLPGCAQQLPGAVYYIDGAQFDALLDTIIKNLYRAGFRAVVAHGHGPSTDAFEAGKKRFAELGMKTFTLWELGYHDARGIQTDHAAANETSLVMALRPELADITKLSGEGTPVAIWGDDPRVHASAQHGRELIEANVARAVVKLRKIADELPHEDFKLEFDNVKSLIKK